VVRHGTTWQQAQVVVASLQLLYRARAREAAVSGHAVAADTYTQAGGDGG
jgi:hypothetical protein